MPDLPQTITCLCSGEQVPADEARRLGCNERGGCPELRDAMDYRDA